MNINSVFPVLNLRENDDLVKRCKYYANLAPLRADTVSFGTRAFKDNGADINLEWTKPINDEIGKIFGVKGASLTQEDFNNEKQLLTMEDFKKIIKFFGYKQINGEGKGRHIKFQNSYEQNYIVVPYKRDKKYADPNATAGLIYSLSIINQTNGELMPQSSESFCVPTEQDIEDFKEKTKEYKENTNNQYRKPWQEAYNQKLEAERLEQERELQAQQAALDEEIKNDEISKTQQKQDEVIEFGERLEFIAYIRAYIEENIQKVKNDESVRNDKMKALKEDIQGLEKELRYYGRTFRKEIDALKKDISDFCEEYNNNLDFKKDVRTINSILRGLDKHSSDAEVASEMSMEELEGLKKTAEDNFNSLSERHREFIEKFQKLTGNIVNFMDSVYDLLVEDETKPASTADRPAPEIIAKFNEKLKKQQKEVKEESIKEPSRQEIMLQSIKSTKNNMVVLSQETLSTIEDFRMFADFLVYLQNANYSDVNEDKVKEIKAYQKDLIKFYDSNLSEEEYEKLENKISKFGELSSLTNADKEKDFEKFMASPFILKFYSKLSETKKMLTEYNEILANYAEKYSSIEPAKEADKILKEKVNVVDTQAIASDSGDNDDERKKIIASIESLAEKYKNLDMNVNIIIQKFDALNRIDNTESRKRDNKRAVKELGEGIIAPLRKAKGNGYNGTLDQINKILENAHDDELTIPELKELQAGAENCLNAIKTIINGFGILSFEELTQKIDELNSRFRENADSSDTAEVKMTTAKPRKKSEKTTDKTVEVKFADFKELRKSTIGELIEIAKQCEELINETSKKDDEIHNKEIERAVWQGLNWREIKHDSTYKELNERVKEFLSDVEKDQLEVNTLYLDFYAKEAKDILSDEDESKYIEQLKEICDIDILKKEFALLKSDCQKPDLAQNFDLSLEKVEALKDSEQTKAELQAAKDNLQKLWEESKVCEKIVSEFREKIISYIDFKKNNADEIKRRKGRDAIKLITSEFTELKNKPEVKNILSDYKFISHIFREINNIVVNTNSYINSEKMENSSDEEKVTYLLNAASEISERLETLRGATKYDQLNEHIEQIHKFVRILTAELAKPVESRIPRKTLQENEVVVVESEPEVVDDSIDEVMENTSLQNEIQEIQDVQEVSYIPGYIENKIVNDITRNIVTMKAIDIFFNDIKSEVRKVFTNQDFATLRDASNEVFEKIIQSKVDQLDNKNSIKQLKRSQMYAIINEIFEENKMNPPEDIYKASLSQINRWIVTLSSMDNGGAEKLDFDGIVQKYKRYRGYLNEYEAKQIAKIFISCFGSMPSEDYRNLMLLLATEGKYFNLLTDATTHKDLKTMLLKMLISDFDDFSGSNYSQRTNQAILSLERNNILNNMEMYRSLRKIK